MMRWFAIAVALTGSGCLSIVVSGEASTGSGSAQTGGQAGGQTTGGQSGQSAGSTTGPAPIPTCAPSSHYVGNVCVLDSCGTNSPRSPCLLGDGGIGVCIAGNCLGTATDPSNCGGPGYVCPVGAQCFNGQCFGSDGGGAFMGSAGCDNCPAGTACILFETPPLHCILQTCGPDDDDRACGQDPTGFCCHGVCLSVYNSEQPGPGNCGGCGTTCPAGMFCGVVEEPPLIAAGCIGAATCAAGSLETLCALGGSSGGDGTGSCCGGACVDFDWDSANCSGCGLSCPAGVECDGGQCVGFSCDTGSCPNGGTCVRGGGGCIPSCSADGTDGNACLVGSCCGGQCVGFDDRDNCGACGVACAPNEVCEGWSYTSLSPYCLAAPSCAPGEPPCIVDGGLGSCCGPACVDMWTDSRNCGQCGFSCPAAAICEGECLIAGMPAGYCGEKTPCPTGEVCTYGGLCMRGCDGTTNFCALPGGELGACCGSKCTDVTSDSDNCGACGAICPAGSVCGNGGSCSSGLPQACPTLPCPAGTICTPSGSCARLGDCANASPNYSCTGAECEGRLDQSSCWLSSSKTGTCCNGQCTDLGEDPSNCGLCDLECASGICAPYGGIFRLPDLNYTAAGSCLPTGTSDTCLASCGYDSACLNGACTPLTSIGSGPCLAADGTIGFWCGNGVCIHPLDDPQNCGACGNSCPPGVACTAGACAGSVCGVGRWGNFCGDAGERTCCPGADCTDTQTDSLNCGACGVTCPPGTQCNAGICS